MEKVIYIALIVSIVTLIYLVIHFVIHDSNIRIDLDNLDDEMQEEKIKTNELERRVSKIEKEKRDCPRKNKRSSNNT